MGGEYHTQPGPLLGPRHFFLPLFTRVLRETVRSLLFLAVREWCVWHDTVGERNEMNVDWSKWALLTVLALYMGTWIGVWWWAIELIVKQGNS
jgi:hypothetical protein